MNFVDQFGELRHFSLSFPKDKTDNMVDKFGISKKLFEPYVETKENRNLRLKQLSEGLFRLSGDVVEVDKNAVILYYSEIFCRPVAMQIAKALAKSGNDSRLNRIEMAMCFVQDIPYGVPEYADGSRHYGGVSTPPKVLIDMSGDCDSKALLFAGILIYLIPADDIIFLNQPEHVLTAIKSKPENGKTMVKYKNATYLIAETAGPGRRMLGEKGKYYKSSFKAEPLSIIQPEIIPFSKTMPKEKLSPTKNIAIKNLSNKTFSLQLSTDHDHWNAIKLEPLAIEIISLEETAPIFVKPADKKIKSTFYNLTPGKAYCIDWNSKKNTWEVFE